MDLTKLRHHIFLDSFLSKDRDCFQIFHWQYLAMNDFCNDISLVSAFDNLIDFLCFVW